MGPQGMRDIADLALNSAVHLSDPSNLIRVSASRTRGGGSRRSTSMASVSCGGPLSMTHCSGVLETRPPSERRTGGGSRAAPSWQLLVRSTVRPFAGRGLLWSAGTHELLVELVDDPRTFRRDVGLAAGRSKVLRLRLDQVIIVGRPVCRMRIGGNRRAGEQRRGRDRRCGQPHERGGVGEERSCAAVAAAGPCHDAIKAGEPQQRQFEQGGFRAPLVNSVGSWLRSILSARAVLGSEPARLRNEPAYSKRRDRPSP
jgi:hypothetical protein